MDNHLSFKDKRALLIAEFEKWNSAEQIVFLSDSMKFLSLSLIKFISAICNDLIEKQAYVKTSRLQLNAGGNSEYDPTPRQQYSNILEEQANDIIYFRVLSEKPIETKLKILLSYLPLLKIQSQNYDLNESLKKAYHDQFQDVFKTCFRNKAHLMECYELALLASLHPIFDENLRLNFKAWVHLFESSINTIKDQHFYNSNSNATKQIASILFTGYSNDGLRKEKIMDYSMTSDEIQNGNGTDHLNDYKLHNSFDNDNLLTSDFSSGLDSATASLNLSLHMATTQSNSNNNNSSLKETIPNNSNNNNESSDASSSNSNKRLLTRTHMPLKLSTSLPPQQTSASTNYSTRGFNSMNPYDDIESSASSINSFNLSVKNLNNHNNLHKQSDNQNYNLNSYSDFDYLNLENVMIPPLSSSSSSVQSIVSSHLAGNKSSLNNNNNNNYNTEKDLKKEEAGIKNVSQWLKHLRLHKYTDYFTNMSYDEILALDDDKLVESNITLGARKKILSNIEKLRNRPRRIKELILNDENCPLNLSTLENILNELTEISITPMKQHNSPPTSLALIKQKQLNLDESDPNDLSQLFIEILDKIQKFLIKQKQEYCGEDCDTSSKLRELTLVYVKIIDKLFLTKAFTDIQNSHMAKLRNSVYDKNQISKQQQQQEVGAGIVNTTFRNKQSIQYNQKFNNSNNLKTFTENSKNIFKPYQIENINSSNLSNFQTSNFDSNVNSVNALQRIKQKTSLRAIGRTYSVPFPDNSNNTNSNNNSLRTNNQQSFLNFNKNNQ